VRTYISHIPPLFDGLHHRSGGCHISLRLYLGPFLSSRIPCLPWDRAWIHPGMLVLPRLALSSPPSTSWDVMPMWLLHLSP
jgi:hypothetical protein